MHRVLTEKDRDLVLSYVAAEPEMSLFIAGDIETMEMEGQLCVWGLAKAASADKDLGAVILRYGDNFVVYSRDGDFDDAEAAVLIDRSMGGDAPGDVNGRADLVARLAPFFPANRLEPCTMASLREVNRDAVGPVPQGVELGLLKAEEVDAWLGLQGTIDEFSLHLDDCIWTMRASTPSAVPVSSTSSAQGCPVWWRATIVARLSLRRPWARPRARAPWSSPWPPTRPGAAAGWPLPWWPSSATSASEAASSSCRCSLRTPRRPASIGVWAFATWDPTPCCARRLADRDELCLLARRRARRNAPEGG